MLHTLHCKQTVDDSCSPVAACDAPMQRAELLQTSDGEYTNGHCLLRAHAKKADTTVLSIVYKGAPTHHVMAPNEDGVFTVNSKVRACAWHGVRGAMGAVTLRCAPGGSVTRCYVYFVFCFLSCFNYVN